MLYFFKRKGKKLDFEIHWDKYSLGDKHIHSMYKPVPASKVLPDWFKRLPNDGKELGDSGYTAKTCRGVYDIMSSGYMFFWPFDARIEKNNEGRLTIFKARTNSDEDFHPHPAFQIDGYPDILLESQHSGVQKLKTPYRIKTPEGTSIFVKQPSYMPELRTEVMEGIIDTDKYYGEFNILFLIKNINTDRKITIKAGTPIAQVIPFIRGEWSIKHDSINEEEDIIFRDMANDIDRFYQKHLWERKVFKDEATK
jgi:hypothetical protein